VRRQAIETLKLVYFQLAYLQQTLPVLEHNDQLLSQIQQVVESRYRVGQGNQQDVLKAQLQHTEILREIAMHHQEEEQLEAQLKQLLNRSQSSPDIVTEALSSTSLKYSDSDLLNLVQGQNPDVRSRSEMVRRQESQVELSEPKNQIRSNPGIETRLWQRALWPLVTSRYECRRSSSSASTGDQASHFTIPVVRFYPEPSRFGSL
jgi:outer membrane protein, heavy metal efflux system